MNQFRSIAGSHFGLAIGALLLSVAVHDAVAEEPQSFESRKTVWEQRLTEFAKKPDKEMISDPMQSLDINNFQGCTVQMTYKPSNGDTIDFKFMREAKELVEFHGHRKSVFCALHDILVFVDYWTHGPGATVTAFDLKAGKQLWKEQLGAIGIVSHFGYSNEVSMAIFGGPKGSDDGEILIEGHEEFGSYLEVRDFKTGKLLAHLKMTNEEYQRRNDSKEN